MRRLLLLQFFIWGVLQLASSQVIESVKFEGLDRTQAAILRAILPPNAGAEPTTDLLKTNRNRLSNWPTIIGLEEHIDTLDNGNFHLRYVIREGNSRYPTALIGGLSDNFWWEAGYQDINWRGRGNTVSAAIRQIDGRFGGRLNYNQRFLRGSVRWGVTGDLERYVSEEPLYFGAEQVDYYYANHSAGLGLTYYLNAQQFFRFSTTFFRESYRKLNPEITTGPLEAEKDKFLLKLAYQHRDVFNHPIQIAGNVWQFSSEVVLEQDQEVPFLLVRGSWQHYRPVGQLGLLAARATVGFSTNRASPFAPFFVDSRVNIRGAGNRVERGTGAAVLNLEYRYVLLDFPYWALQGVGFVDLGSWRNPGGELVQLVDGSTVKYFSGVGIRVLLGRWRQIGLRLDYGWGIHPIGTQGVVFGLGQYF